MPDTLLPAALRDEIPDPLHVEADTYGRAEAIASPLTPDRVLIAATSAMPVAFNSTDVAWLDMEGADLSVLRTGRAPLLDGHGYQLGDVLGVIERAVIEGGTLYVTARWARATAAREVAALVADGIIRNVSIGLAYTADDEPDGTGARRVNWWRPYEVSLVALPRNWAARVLHKHIPLRVRRALLAQIAEADGGTPETWRAWAATAAGPLARHMGLSPAALDAALFTAVEAELARLSADAASRFADALGLAPLAGPGAP